MSRKHALTAALSVAVCGALALVPVAAAAPKDPTPPPVSTPGATPPSLPPLPSLPSPTPQPWGWPNAATPTPAATPTATPTPTPTKTGSPLTIQEDPRRDRERLAQSWRTIGKFGGATGSTADLAGLALGGERDEKKLDESVAEANRGLDNLLAIMPGGSLSRAKERGYDIRSTIELLKQDNRAFKDAGVRGDVVAIMTQAAFTMFHLALLAFDIFFGLGLSFAQAFLPFPLPDFKLPDLSKQATQTPTPTATPTPPAEPAKP
ncbi:hypothetical protein [Streptomyces sp. NPDC059009]|uniref:hypothetical protein n=1 Tax=Streptomyces sp. NPDC059009 TaxID=3346694 RepID=UPI00368099C2